jgi:hypothetical protein
MRGRSTGKRTPPRAGEGIDCRRARTVVVQRIQTSSAGKSTFDDTVAAYEIGLDAADTLLLQLHGASVNGQLRDFRDSLDATRAALAVLKSTCGPVL